jgi:TolB-like protein
MTQMVMLGLACALFWATTDASAQRMEREGLEEACARAAEKLTECKSVKGKTVTVRPFVGADGQRTLLGIRLQDLMIHALSGPEKKTYRVVERVRLSDLDTEQLLYGEGTDDLEQWAKALKADLVVLGSYAVEPEKLVLTCRLVAPATGDCVTSATAWAAKTRLIERWATTPAPVTPMKMAMEAIGLGAGGQKQGGRSPVALFQIRGGTMQGFPAGQPIQVRVGESVGFSVQPPMDCWLYVLNYDPQSLEDLAVFLYPLPQFSPMVFKKGRTYFFPRDVDPKALTYPVDPPYGRMVFKVIGVEAGVTDADLTGGLGAGDGYYELDREGLKKMMARLRALPDAAWWEESLEFWITGE